MAKIVQSLTRASDEYRSDVAHSLVRDLDEEAVEAYNNYRENTPAIINPISFEEFVEVTGKN